MLQGVSVRLVFLVAGLLIGVASGAAGMLVAFPYLFPLSPVHETAELFSLQLGSPLLEGVFREHSRGQDFLHWGRGSFNIRDTDGEKVILEFQEDFEVAPGPNFWIYLNSEPVVDTEEEFLADARRKPVAKLKSFAGSQVYQIDRTRLAAAKSITIWCASFDQFIASATFVNAETRRSDVRPVVELSLDPARGAQHHSKSGL